MSFRYCPAIVELLDFESRNPDLPVVLERQFDGLRQRQFFLTPRLGRKENKNES